MPTTTCGCPEYQQAGLARRALLRFAGAAGLAAVTLPGGARVAFGAPGGGTVVVLSLRGGFDGLSAVVPLGDPNYAKLRPGIGIPASQAKKVDSMFGLHPALKPVYDLWDAGSFAAVHAVGQVNPTRSHFEAMDEMERAAPSSSIRTGWIDRTLGEVASPDTFTVTQVGSPTLPRSMVGPHAKFGLGSINDVKTAIDPKQVPLATWRKALSIANATARQEVSAPLRNALGAVKTITPLRTQGDENAAAVAAGYPAGNLGRALHDLATLITADIGVRVATLDYGDWDMHVGLGRSDSGWMHDHLTELATALAAFAKQLGSKLGSTTLLTLSEFGRRVEENGSGGLDHGHGNAVLVLGGGIKGGAVHGKWPGLGPTELADGDLAGTTDYRSIVAEAVQHQVGVGTAPVFPGFKPVATGLF